jgi:hypothetical protein
MSEKLFSSSICMTRSALIQTHQTGPAHALVRRRQSRHLIIRAANTSLKISAETDSGKRGSNGRKQSHPINTTCVQLGCQIHDYTPSTDGETTEEKRDDACHTCVLQNRIGNGKRPGRCGSNSGRRASVRYNNCSLAQSPSYQHPWIIALFSQYACEVIVLPPLSPRAKLSFPSVWRMHVCPSNLFFAVTLYLPLCVGSPVL